MQDKLLFGILLISLLVGCQKPLWQKQTKGFQSYNKGEFWYQWYGTNSKAPKAKEDEQVRMDYTILKGTKVLQTSFGSKKPVFVQIPASQFDNFFTKALKLMAIGDSLHVKIKATDIPDLLGEFANEFEEDELVDFYYKCYDIKDKKTIVEEIKIQKAKIDSTKQFVSQLVYTYIQKDSLANIQKTASGLQYIRYNDNHKSTITNGSQASIHYICYNQNGKVIDESFASMIPLNFEVGSPSLIDGLSEGVQLLSEGENALLIIPPHLAYGETGSGDLIPPNSTIFFYIELLSIN